MLAEAAGTAQIEIDDFNGETLGDLRNAVESKFPQLKNKMYKIAQNRKLVNENEKLTEHDEIAFLPPFAGG